MDLGAVTMRLLLRMPIVGRLTRGVNTARFTRTLSILAGSGVPILEALNISAEVIENLPMRDAVMEATLRVREGGSISKSLATSKLFPPMMIHLISSGEAGGRLEEMLSRAAAGQEREVRRSYRGFARHSAAAAYCLHGSHRTDDSACNFAPNL